MEVKTVTIQSSHSKVALVTGGASGIGLSVAEALARDSYRVVIADINDEKGGAAASRLDALYVHLDVADEASWQTAMNFIEENAGRLDVLVNNAGIYAAGSIEEISVSIWQAIQSVNILGVLLGCQAAISLMKRQGGAIINISSGAALRPKSTSVLYSASKSAVWNITRTTALHCAEKRYNIRCNSVHPGMVDTDMVAKRVDSEEARKALYEQCNQLHPMGRMANASDIAEAVVFLASDKASYMTGVALPVDGGYAVN